MRDCRHRDCVFRRPALLSHGRGELLKDRDDLFGLGIVELNDAEIVARRFGLIELLGDID